MGSFASPQYCYWLRNRQCTNALFSSCLFYAQSIQVGTARVGATLKLRARGDYLPNLLGYIFLNSNQIAYLTD